AASQAIATQTVVDRLKYREFFSLFPSYVRDGLVRRATYKNLEPGEMIFQHGDSDPFMGAVLEGRLRMGMNMQNAKGVLLGLVEPDEVFGEMSLLDGVPRTIDAVAAEHSRVIIFKRDDLL